MKTRCVYRLDIGNDFYVGATSDFTARQHLHRYAARARRQSKRLQRAFDKHGIDAAEYTVLEEVSSHLLGQREDWWMAHLKPTLNTYSSHRGPVGVSRTQQEKDNISKKLKGRPKPVGHGDRVSRAMKGYKKSPEHLAKIADAVRKRATDPRYQQSMRERARKHSPEFYKKMFCLKKNGVPQVEIAQRLGISPASVSLTLRGLQNPDMRR